MPGDITAPLIVIRQLVNGAPERLPDRLHNGIKSFTFEDGDKKADKATIVFGMTQEMLEADPAEWIAIFGRTLVVSWGYRGWLSAPRTMGVKTVKAQGEDFIVTAFDTSVDMMRHRRARGWSGLKRSDVVREIAAEWGYSDQFVTDSEVVYPSINQKAESDATFMARLAKLEGFAFWVGEDGLHWRPRDFNATPTHTFTWRKGERGQGLITSWSCGVDLLTAKASTAATSVDPKTGQQTTAVAKGDGQGATLSEVAQDLLAAQQHHGYYSAPVGIKQGSAGGLFDEEALRAANPNTPAVAPTTFERMLPRLAIPDVSEAASTSSSVPSATTSPAAARREAEARFRVAAQSRMKMGIEIVGDPTVHAKGLIQVDGLGPVFSGGYYVASVTHKLDSGGYTASLKLKGDGAHRSKPAADPTKKDGLNATDPEARQRSA